LGRTPSYQDIYRYANDIEALVLSTTASFWLEREPRAAGWREAVEALEVDPKSLDKGHEEPRTLEVVKPARNTSAPQNLHDDTAAMPDEDRSATSRATSTSWWPP
jgi:hypothetical protein